VPDNEATAGAAQKLTEASYNLDEQFGNEAMVASAIVLGAGNCDQNGAIDAVVHSFEPRAGCASR
jgi:hypothetical protein